MVALDLTNKRFGKLIAIMDCITTSKSRITDEEWDRLVKGYKQITGEDYEI